LPSGQAVGATPRSSDSAFNPENPNSDYPGIPYHLIVHAWQVKNNEPALFQPFRRDRRAVAQML